MAYLSGGSRTRLCDGSGPPDLLQAPARHQATEVDGEETGRVEQPGDRGLGRGVVAGQEDHPATARLMGDPRPGR
jgi:hypothetical protein